ncbi:MAG: YabP/YqfC family sporulation protein, partial [Lachnospiraceae bacterium]|nr:YabP/YqfC family sporulation protein [Lachnospiraceae bacterium]
MTVKRQIIERATGKTISIPKEVLTSCSVVTAVGRTEITVDGHGGIISYETTHIRVKTGNGCVVIEGSNLVIDYYHNEELKIVGCIKGIIW